jgi:starch phosphorylase
VTWRNDIEEHWRRLRFGSLKVESAAGQHTFTIQVFLDELNPEFAAVELFADAGNGEKLIREPMTRGPALAGSENSFSYSKTVTTKRPAADFTPRIIPAHPAALVPLECPRILWYR